MIGGLEVKNKPHEKGMEQEKGGGAFVGCK